MGVGDWIDFAQYIFFMTYVAGFLVIGFLFCILPNEPDRKFRVIETVSYAAVWWLVLGFMFYSAFHSTTRPAPWNARERLQPRPRANKALRKRVPDFFE